MRRYVIAILLTMTFLLAGCGLFEDTPGLTVKENGEIKSYIAEEFSEDYYDETELHDSIQADIAEYNGEEEKIKLTKFKVTGDDELTLTAVMEYSSATDYEEFNGEVLYIGSVAEALKEGYGEDCIFMTSEDENSKLTLNEIDQKGAYHLIMFTEPVSMKAPKKIQYYSEGLELDDNEKRVNIIQEDKEIYCIIYE